MSATAAPQARRFRLSPLDPTGLMFGLGFVQLTLVAAGVLAGSILMVTYSVSLGFIVLIVGSGLGLFRLHGASVVDQDVIVVDPGPLGLGQSGAEIAISRDRKAGTYAATLRVAGRQFALIDNAEQDWLVTQWGTAL